MTGIDATDDPALRSWVPGADSHAGFPIQNLPLGMFSPPGAPARAGVAIGDSILDLVALCGTRLLDDDAAQAVAPAGSSLNAMLAAGAGHARRSHRYYQLAARQNS